MADAIAHERAPEAAAPSAGAVAPRRLPYYSLSEVAKHNVFLDCWVVVLGRVLDLTPALRARPSTLTHPLVAFAGQDISHWFNPATRDPKTCVEPNSGLRVFYTPHGPFLDIPVREPRTDAPLVSEVPWWRDESLVVGLLSKRTRIIRIINTLTGQEHEVEVCYEQTVEEIRKQYKKLNAHADSYVWKFNGLPLNMDKTLQENGVVDHDGSDSSATDDIFRPALLLFFRDDLTVA